MSAALFFTGVFIAPQFSRFAKMLCNTDSKIHKMILPVWLKQKSDQAFELIESIPLAKRFIQVILPDNLLYSIFMSYCYLPGRVSYGLFPYDDIVFLTAKVGLYILWVLIGIKSGDSIRNWVAERAYKPVAYIIGPSDYFSPLPNLSLNHCLLYTSPSPRD